MSDNLKKFKNLLEELFQMDQADLDFGIYRIMNAKRDEISKFLDEDLLPQVNEELGKLEGQKKVDIQKELDETIARLSELKVDPEENEIIILLREQLAQAVDITAIENEIFSDLYNFFRRYYKDGDFISQRRYKKDVYAIPYEGEEVKLYWANHDQYYIKTSENFRDYTFKVGADEKLVHFKLVDADTERDNIKAQNGNDRRFILCEDDPLFKENGELYIRFEYRPDDDKRKQDALIGEAIEKITDSSGFTNWLTLLLRKEPTDANPNRTVLEKHLKHYTARNTFDYFIHKDLGKFLNRELDFFIKNEIMHLDDIESAEAPKVEQYLAKIKALRKIAHKIIDFLAQIEDFQKKLWLKKKFVVDTNYCITLDRIPEEFYPEIASNDAQREEWVRLFAIDEIKAGESELFDGASPAYSNPLTVEFLKANPFLALDTRFFSDSFKARLIASVENIDEQCDGLLVNSDNYQALSCLQQKYKGKLQSIYIDPPFNTVASEILYKNNYKHSSWLCLINERLQNSIQLMKNDAIFCIAIDDAEQSILADCLSNIFGDDNHLGTVVVRSNPHGRAMAAGISSNHEYSIFYAKSRESIVGRLPRDDRRQSRYPDSDERGIFAWINFRKTGAGSRRVERPKLFYPIYVSDDGEIRITTMSWSDVKRKWIPDEAKLPNETIVLPLDSENNERVWNLGWERARYEINKSLSAKLVDDKWQVYRKYRPNQDGALPGTWWEEAKYSATESGTRIIKDLFGERELFSYPKSIYLVEDCLRVTNLLPEASVMDYFAGSGTTGHAVINLNREDGGHRKYILVEMGEYFDTVLKPRIQKVIYSKDWKDGKPVSREGSSHIFKYIKLESYEDTLNNLELTRSREQDDVLLGEADLREDYMLHYMLDIESRGSDSLLNIDKFDDPFNYKLNIAQGTVGETKPQTVDLVETFNYLIGLRVNHIGAKEYLTAKFKRDDENKLILDGRLKTCEPGKGWEFQMIEGENPEGKKVLIIWRTLKGDPEEDNLILDELLERKNISSLDFEYDLIYVNGDNNVENKRHDDATWKVRMIEPEFHHLMFESEGV